MRSPKWWLSLAAGAMLAAVFPPFDLPWLLMPVAVALWFHCTRDVPLRTVLWRSLAFAMGFYLLLLKWMLVVGIDAWILLALLQSLYFLIVAVVRHRMAGRNWELLSIALAWSAQDWLRDHAPFAAFGWGQLAFASIDAPWSQFAAYGGQIVVTALAALTGLALARMFAGSFPRRLIGLGTLVLALSVPLLLPTNTPGSGVRLALVQGGVDHTGLGFIGDRNAVLYRHRDLTEQTLRNTDVGAVVWPENASDADPFTDPNAARALHDAANAAGKPILFGAVLTGPDGRRNVSMIAYPFRTEFEVVYQKQRLVPFGEFLPFRDFLTRVTDRVEFLPIDFLPGNDPATLRIRGNDIGIVICFEVADQDLVGAALASGETALIVQTNNATYAGTGQSEQQLRIAQFRARSFGRPVYVISTNGPTAVITEHGDVVERVVEGDTGVLYTSVVAHA